MVDIKSSVFSFSSRTWLIYTYILQLIFILTFCLLDFSFKVCFFFFLGDSRFNGCEISLEFQKVVGNFRTFNDTFTY